MKPVLPNEKNYKGPVFNWCQSQAKHRVKHLVIFDISGVHFKTHIKDIKEPKFQRRISFGTISRTTMIGPELISSDSSGEKRTVLILKDKLCRKVAVVDVETGKVDYIIYSSCKNVNFRVRFNNTHRRNR